MFILAIKNRLYILHDFFFNRDCFTCSCLAESVFWRYGEIWQTYTTTVFVLQPVYLISVYSIARYFFQTLRCRILLYSQFDFSIITWIIICPMLQIVIILPKKNKLSCYNYFILFEKNFSKCHSLTLSYSIIEQRWFFPKRIKPDV